MAVSRRQFLAASLGLIAAGCTERTVSYSNRPGLAWPEQVGRPQSSHSYLPPSPRPVHPPTAVAPPPAPAPAATLGSLQIIPRSQWAKAAPVAGRLNPMGSINRITVHHEGWQAVWFSDMASTAARIELDRTVHVRDRGWADIGYHYIIDRAGRVWEGRSVQHQGAHVRGHNEQNIGVMLLGNFDYQSATAQQLASLRETLTVLMRQHRVPVNRIYTHQELTPTACPGKALQPRMASLRAGGYLG